MHHNSNGKTEYEKSSELKYLFNKYILSILTHTPFQQTTTTANNSKSSSRSAADKTWKIIEQMIIEKVCSSRDNNQCLTDYVTKRIKSCNTWNAWKRKNLSPLYGYTLISNRFEMLNILAKCYFFARMHTDCMIKQLVEIFMWF